MHDTVGPLTVYGALKRVAESTPEAIALRFEGQELSYRDLLIEVDRVAAILRGMGISQCDRFGVLAPNCPETLFTYYAASKLAAVFVPLNAALSAEEAAYIVQHSNVRFLFVPDEMAEIGRKAAGDRMRRINALSVTPYNSVSHLPAPLSSPDDDFLLIYTSGSTGTPKAVMLSQAAQIAAPIALSKMWDIGPGAKVLVALPLGFLYGLSTACAVALQAGAQVILMDRFHPARVLEAMTAEQVSHFQGVPTMYSMMLEYCEQRDLSFDLSGIKVLVSAGAPLSLETVRRFRGRFGKHIDNYYAMTEVTPIFGRYQRDLTPIPEDAVGKAAPGAEIRILAQDGTPCAVGEIGEIVVRGAATMSRYDGDPKQTAQAMHDGYFRSGDLGYRDAEGHYSITGRSKDIIIRGGANIAPAEVEAVLSTHPAVQEVAVIGLPDRILGEVPVAIMVLRHAAQATARELKAHAEEHLAEFKVPRRYEFRDTLPLGKTGKIDKAALKTQIATMLTESGQ